MNQHIDYKYIEKLFLEIEHHALLRSHATLVAKARKEKEQLMIHKFVWVGNDPFYEEDVLELLEKNDLLMEMVDNLIKMQRNIDEQI